MAKKSRASSPYQRGLVYHESFFPNRNDMLQTALDNVLAQQKEDAEKAALALEIYKEYLKSLDKDIDRLKKLQDNLRVKAIDAKAATDKFNAGQTNSSRRTVYTTQAANARFNARQAALAAYFGSKPVTAGGKQGPIDPISANEARQAYAQNPSDVRAGIQAMKSQQAATTEVPKTVDERNIGLAYTFGSYVSDEAAKSEYDEWGQDRYLIAASKLMETLDAADKDAVTAGLQKLEASKGMGAGAQVGGTEDVSTGGLKTSTVKAPSYEDLIKQIDADIKAAELDKEAKKKAMEAAQEAATPEDLITAQRREYFNKFYPNETPAFMINEQLSNLLKMNEGDAQRLIQAFRARTEADRLAGRMPAETPLGEEVVSSIPRYAAGKEGPRMAGDVIYGDKSPFVPSPEDMTAGVRQAVDYDAIMRTVSPEMRSQVGRALTQDQLFAIEGSEKAKASLQAKGLSIVGGRLVPTAELQKRLEVGGQVEVPQAPPVESVTVAGGEPFAAIRDRELATLSAQDMKAKELLARAQKERDDAAIAAKSARSPQDILNASRVLQEKTDLLNELLPLSADTTKLLDIATKRGFAAAAEDKMLQTRVNPLGIDKRQDVKAVEALPEPTITPEQKDAQIKIRAAMKAKQLYDSGELEKATKTDVGMAVSNLYNANKAKGDQSVKDILSYISKEFPRSSEQEEAATVLFGLNYKESRDKLLSDDKGAAKPVEPPIEDTTKNKKK